MLNKGFTIIESLVAILIFTIGIVPFLHIGVLSNNIATNIQNNIIANNLAQEGLEVVRSIRDASWHDGDPKFNTDLPNGEWRIQWDSTALTSVGINPPLKIDGNGIYNYSSGTDTHFRRKLTIIEINPDIEIRVISEVSWPSKEGITMIKRVLSGGTKVYCPSGTRCLDAELHLYNWQ
jgi:prepilin-type N-terminal cleavage/methylation domain-containing protein